MFNVVNSIKNFANTFVIYSVQRNILFFKKNIKKFTQLIILIF